jgi:hypothetical protein
LNLLWRMRLLKRRMRLALLLKLLRRAETPDAAGDAVETAAARAAAETPVAAGALVETAEAAAAGVVVVSA